MTVCECSCIVLSVKREQQERTEQWPLTPTSATSSLPCTVLTTSLTIPTFPMTSSTHSPMRWPTSRIPSSTAARPPRISTTLTLVSMPRLKRLHVSRLMGMMISSARLSQTCTRGRPKHLERPLGRSFFCCKC